MKKGLLVRSTFDSYIIGEQIGSGGAGSVYSATDSEGQVVAVKVLDSNRAQGRALKRFHNEIHFCSSNVHPNIIRVLDRGLTDAGAPFYVMQKYSASLRRRLQTGISPGEVLPVFAQMLDGVEAAHLKGVLHRDLKPENFLSNESGSVVVADFGIARFEEEMLFTAVDTKDDERLANFVYAAPEQRRRGETFQLRLTYTRWA